MLVLERGDGGHERSSRGRSRRSGLLVLAVFSNETMCEPGNTLMTRASVAACSGVISLRLAARVRGHQPHVAVGLRVQQHLDAERLEALDVLGGEAAKLVDVDRAARRRRAVSERARSAQASSRPSPRARDVGQRVAEQVARDGFRCRRMLDDGRRRDDEDGSVRLFGPLCFCHSVQTNSSGKAHVPPAGSGCSACRPRPACTSRR